MSGDLEDFLRRAAQRRAEKQQSAAGPSASGQSASGPSTPSRTESKSQPKPQTKPQYTDARRERQVRQDFEEDIPVAEIVETVDTLSEKQKQIAKTKQRAAAARAEIAAQQEAAYGDRSKQASNSPLVDGTPIEQLLEMLRRPAGVQQAFLLREILERPEERW